MAILAPLWPHPKGPLDFLYRTARYLVPSIALLAFRRLLGYRLVLTFHGMELDMAAGS